MNESQPSRDRVRPHETAELQPGWRLEDRHFLVRLNAATLPRAAVAALGTTLPSWRSLNSPEGILKVVEEQAEPTSARRNTAKKHARIALELYRRLQLPGFEVPPCPAVSTRETDEEDTGQEDTNNENPDNQNPSEYNGAPIEVTTYADRSYPELLRDLPLPPPVLFHRGELPSGAAIAIVGSRRADSYGREVAHRFAHALAERGLPIISGFARGIDQTAHRGALTGSCGSTVAVLGCGLDIDYPSGSHELATDIATRGAMISEFPPLTGPVPQNFPIRNRIIAALSVGTLVIQGTERSGSLITARLALELGRDVYAVPGRITDKLSSGTNLLIRDGAFPALSPDDVLDTLPAAIQVRLLDPPTEPRKPETDAREKKESGAYLLDKPTAPPPPHLEAIFNRLGRDPTPLETLASGLELPMDRLLGSILELELGGWLERLPGPAARRRS